MVATKSPKTLRQRGVSSASRFLTRKGYTILEEAWRCKAGNVDLIAEDEDALVFIDVQTHTNNDTGFFEETMDKDTHNRWEKIAIEYLTQADVANKAIRFDAVSLLVMSDERALLKHHVDALSQQIK